MKSIIDLSKILGCNPTDLNRLLVNRSIPVMIEFGISDGFIQDETYDYIIDKYNERLNSIFTIEEIIENKSNVIPIKQSAYLYFLFYDHEMVYIGQTNSLMLRLYEHQSNRKDFNYVSAFEVDQKRLLEIEQIHIFTYRPPLNVCIYDKIVIINSIIKLL